MRLMSGVGTDQPDTTITVIQHNNKEEALLNFTLLFYQTVQQMEETLFLLTAVYIRYIQSFTNIYPDDMATAGLQLPQWCCSLPNKILVHLLTKSVSKLIFFMLPKAQNHNA